MKVAAKSSHVSSGVTKNITSSGPSAVKKSPGKSSGHYQSDCFKLSRESQQDQGEGAGSSLLKGLKENYGGGVSKIDGPSKPAEAPPLITKTNGGGVAKKMGGPSKSVDVIPLITKTNGGGSVKKMTGPGKLYKSTPPIAKTNQ